jgi:hypothetical protein
VPALGPSFSRRRIGANTRAVEEKERRRKKVHVCIFDYSEREQKKKRGAIRTNDLCIFSPSSSLACGLERERERGKKADEQIKHVAAVTSHSSFQIVLLIISCSSTFFNKQRTGEKKDSFVEKIKISPDDHLHV